MKVKDLVWRSALRSRAAGEVEVPPEIPTVIEVTNLVVPAGTDFNSPGSLKIGEFTLRVDQLLVEWFLFLEVDPGPGSEHLLMYVAPVDDPGSMALADRLGTAQQNDVEWWFRGPVQYVAPIHLPETKTLGVYLDPGNDTDGGFTYTPITVIRARASFLVI